MSMSAGLTQKDLENAVQTAMERALKGMGEKILSEVRQEVKLGLHDARSARGSQYFSHESPAPNLFLSSTDQHGNLNATSKPGWKAPDDISVQNFADGYMPLSQTTTPRTDPQKEEDVNYGSSLSPALHDQLWQPKEEPGTLAALVKSVKFEVSAGVLVMTYALFIGAETQADCMHKLNARDPEPIGFEVGEFIFMCLFLIEWIMRVCVNGRSWFCSDKRFWAAFDTFIVSTQVLDQVFTLTSLSKEANSNMNSISLVRILRLLRIVRVLRLFHLFDEVQKLVDTLAATAQVLCWSVMLMFTAIFAVSVFFARMALQASEGTMSDELAYWFGDIPRAFLTLLESLIGGVSWDEPIMVLVREVNVGVGVCFVAYIAVGLFAVMNVITGTCIDTAMKRAEKQAGLTAVLELEHAFRAEIEQGHDITWPVFHLKLNDPEMIDCLEKMHLEIGDVKEMFDLMDADGSGAISAKELVPGLEKLREPARAFHVAQLLRDNLRISDEISRDITMIKERLDSLRKVNCNIAI